MPSKREQEGLLEIDHRNGGFTLEQCIAAGLPPFLAGDKLFRVPTKNCRHCGKEVIINPDRVRARAYCPKCDHFICDRCETIRVLRGGECAHLHKRFEKHLQQTQARKEI